jgi:putative transposase
MIDHCIEFSIEMMCKVFKISKSSYYAWLRNGPSDRWKENESLLVDILDIFEDSKGSYGSPRITKELHAQGKKGSRPRVARIMRAAGIQARRRRKFKVTTDSKHNYPIAPNVLDRKFSATRPSEIWVSDLTYVRTHSGWLYLTVIIDLFDRKVVGWSMSKDLTTANTIILAWFMAITNRPITEDLIFHSDRGIQYACDDFTKLLKSNELIIRSMSRKGNCWDNAVAESFFKTIKVEWIYTNSFVNQTQATLSIFEWIESWYNKRRRHSALGYKTIDEFEIINSNFNNAA